MPVAQIESWLVRIIANRPQSTVHGLLNWTSNIYLLDHQPIQSEKKSAGFFWLDLREKKANAR